MRPKLTKEQRDALAHSAGEPVEVEDDQRHIYLLITREEFRQGHKVVADPEKLKAAILDRRDKSRELNADWEHVDREIWGDGSPSNA